MAKVLAGEANSPGKYSKRTVSVLSSLDKNDAQLFTKLCSFGIVIDNIVPLIYDDEHPIYTDNGINFDILSHLETIGLIQFGEIAGFIRKGLPQKINLYYYGTKLSIEFQFLEDNQFDLGKVLLTQAGHQLAQICSPSPREGFLEYARQKWISLGYKVE